MAVEPLFIADMTTLRARLRLSEANNQDAQDLIDQAVEDVRVLIFDEGQGLGVTRVTQILAIAYVENATTANDLTRTRANNLELMWVKLHLLRSMPTLFIDGSGVTLEAWNDEPLTRRSDRAISEEISRLQDAIDKALAALGLGDEDDQGDIDTIVIEPDVTPDRPGASIKPTLYRNN